MTDGSRAPAGARSSRVQRFRRPSAESVLTEAVQALARHRGGSLSQRRLLEELRPWLAQEDPPARLSGRRLRSLLVGSPRIRLEVLYATRASRPTFTACPVCGGRLLPRENRTLEGGRAVVGYRCERCPFWTPRRWRVPSRYRFWLRRGGVLRRRRS